MWIQKKESQQIAEMFKTISHPERIAILSFICHCPECTCRVKNIYEGLQLSQSNVSRHLGLMKKQDIVRRMQKNGETYFSVNLHNKIVKCIHSCLNEYITKSKRTSHDQ